MKPYVVFGAGAVGSALAAYLSRRGHPVKMVARAAHVEAIERQGGIRTVSRSETFVAPVTPTTSLSREVPPEAVLLLTVQAPDVGQAVEAVAAHAASHPVVTFQNGIRAEETAAPFCPSLYGGIIRFTATMLRPGEVRLRGPGKVIVGRHPTGTDSTAADLVRDFANAGFTAAESPNITSEKALKLLINLISGPPVLLKRTGKEPVLAAVQVAVLEEAARVFARAGIDARPLSGIGQPVEELIAHFRAGGSAPDTSGDVYNSTWQNLHHRRPRLENDFYHGEILRLGRTVGVDTPVNARVLEVLEDVRASGLGPTPFDRDTFRSRFEDVLDLDAFLGETGGEPSKDALEI
jgi:2-dehydropantoate 2-reductase